MLLRGRRSNGRSTSKEDFNEREEAPCFTHARPGAGEQSVATVALSAHAESLSTNFQKYAFITSIDEVTNNVSKDPNVTSCLHILPFPRPHLRFLVSLRLVRRS